MGAGDDKKGAHVAVRYQVVCNEDVAKVVDKDGVVLVELGRTCPYCGTMCDIELAYGLLLRACKKCNKQWEKSLIWRK